jgi:hypothetical protein
MVSGPGPPSIQDSPSHTKVARGKGSPTETSAGDSRSGIGRFGLRAKRLWSLRSRLPTVIARHGSCWLLWRETHVGRFLIEHGMLTGLATLGLALVLSPRESAETRTRPDPQARYGVESVVSSKPLPPRIDASRSPGRRGAGRNPPARGPREPVLTGSSSGRPEISPTSRPSSTGTTPRFDRGPPTALSS